MAEVVPIDGGRRHRKPAPENCECIRVVRLRALAAEVTALARRVEREGNVSAERLRSAAVQLENRADLIEVMSIGV